MVNYSYLLNQRKSLHSPPRKAFKKSKTIKIKKIEKILNFIDDWMNGINVEQNEKANEHSKI